MPTQGGWHLPRKRAPQDLNPNGALCNEIAITRRVDGGASSRARHGCKPGLYSANDTNEICLAAGGSWYSPTYSGWVGQWEVIGNSTFIWGNFTYEQYQGYGNASRVIKGKSGTWTEWLDDLTYGDVFDPITFTLISRNCADTSGCRSDTRKVSAQK